jgi:NADPH:quinone reductase-like Zn-dependent oxidoreductase
VQNQKDLVLMTELLESGQVVPVIDACYPLSRAAEALWYCETEHAKGKVVITVESNAERFGKID